MTTILVTTTAGLNSFDPAGNAGPAQLVGHHVRALAPESWERLWAVVDRREIWRAGTAEEWECFATLDDLDGASGLEVACLADTRANPLGGILAGTTEARLVRVTETGELSFVEGFEQAAGRSAWYTPWGGPPGTRSITEDRDTVYVNVHVGGVLRSRDEGESWEPTIDISADVHQVATADGRLYAAGARGLSVSRDRGDTWSHNAGGLHGSYCRAITVCGSHLLVSASTGPGHGQAALYSSSLDGTDFQRCREGLPEWFQGNLDSLCLDALPDGRLAAFASEAGDLYASSDQGISWTHLAGALGEVTRVLVLP